MTGIRPTSSVSQLRGALRAGEVSSRELVELYLERGEQYGAALNAVVTVDAEGALAAADAADAQRAAGSELALLGVPFTVKDALETRGIASTGGSPLMRQHMPAKDAAAVMRLRDAGAVLFGKTNTPQYCGDVQTYNEIFGRTNNPWDPSRTTGGSSGGSASAVAAGLTAFDVGTDLGGSLRIPAHFCGIFAHKPSFGVVDQHGYIDQLGGSVIEPDVNVVGPLARSADDLALLLDVMHRSGHDRDYGWRVDLAPARPGLRDCRVGVWFDDRGCPLDSGYADVLSDLIADLDRAGVSVREAHPAVEFNAQVELWLQLISAAASVAPPDQAEGELLAGSHLGWIRRQEQRARFAQRWREWFREYDILLCPVWAREAFLHDTDGTLYDRTVDVNGMKTNHIDAGRWTGLIGVVGLPSTVVPVGMVNGLPVGVQVVAPYLHDYRAIRVAGEISELRGGRHAPPGYDVAGRGAG